MVEEHSGSCSGGERADHQRTRATNARLLTRLQQFEAEQQDRLEDDAARHADIETVVQELQVHQAELELQNNELQDAQVRLEESRSRFYELYHGSPTAIVTVGSDGIIQEANKASVVLLQGRSSRLIGQSLHDFFAPESRAALQRCLRDYTRVASSHDFEGFLAIEAGLPPVALRVCARAGVNASLHLSLINVSDRHNFDRQLRFLLDVGDTLFELLDVSMVGDRVASLTVPFLGEATCFYASSRPKRLSLATSAPLESGCRDDLSLLSYQLQGSRLVARALEERRLVVADVTKRADRPLIASIGANLRPFLANFRTIAALPILSRRAVVGVVLLYQHALTQRRHYPLAFFSDLARRLGLALDNAELFERSKKESQARKNLLAVVSHDLRNPLSVIMMKAAQFGQLQIAPGNADEKRLQRGAQVITLCARRMNDLIGDLLDATNIESGSFQILAKPELLLPLVEESADACRDAIVAKGLELTVKVDASLDPSTQVRCDRRRVLQVVVNLLGNALKFTEVGGDIHLHVEREDGWIIFKVADTGVGMESQATTKVFEKFWQNEATAHLGSGLGLTICKGIVEASGGKIWVESIQGSGSTFYFSLPLAAQADAASSNADALVDAHGRPTQS